MVIVTQLHPEVTEDDVHEAFGEFGPVTALHLNLDRRTGYVKGYALLEYATEDEARRCVDEADGMELLERPVKVDFAFRRPDPTHASDHRSGSAHSRNRVRRRDDRR